MTPIWFSSQLFTTRVAHGLFAQSRDEFDSRPVWEIQSVRPQVKQVSGTLRLHEPIQIYRAVMNKLDAHTSLVYSCVGWFIAVAQDVILEIKVESLPLSLSPCRLRGQEL